MTKEQNLLAEVMSVKSMQQWERSVLAEADSKFDPYDNSSDEEAMAVRKLRKPVIKILEKKSTLK